MSDDDKLESLSARLEALRREGARLEGRFANGTDTEDDRRRVETWGAEIDALRHEIADERVSDAWQRMVAAIGQAFQELHAREEAAPIAELFISGRLGFDITRERVQCRPIGYAPIETEVSSN